MERLAPARQVPTSIIAPDTSGLSVQTMGRSGMSNSWHILLAVLTDDASVIALRGGP
jgi:hypothetical protein